MDVRNTRPTDGHQVHAVLFCVNFEPEVMGVAGMLSIKRAQRICIGQHTTILTFGTVSIEVFGPRKQHMQQSLPS